MRAALYREHGPSEVLTLEDLAVPEPGPGEVRVAIRRSAVNPTDWKQRQGGGERRPISGFPFIVPNQDGAGDIDAVGPGVDAVRVGQRVWTYFTSYRRQFGTASEFVCVPESQAVELPANASYELGASLGIPALTAHRCLFADGSIHGRTVLVAGGAGAVGHYAIELAKRAGARVVATVSGDEKGALAQQAGADLVVNYRDASAAEQVLSFAPGGLDRVVEVALDTNMALNVAVLAPFGVVSTYATEAVPPSLEVGQLMRRNISLRFVLVYTMGATAVAAAVGDVTAAVRAAELTELPAHHFSLARAAEAHDAVEAGAIGKVFIDI
jgi:NADPH2:quinone reductase